MIKCSCKVCGKIFYLNPSRVKNGRGKHCSKKCMYLSFKGKHFGLKTEFKKGYKSENIRENHPKWKGGKFVNNGYIFILSRNHPYANYQKYVQEHRLVAEKCLNRYLKSCEVIHHINGIKDDNRPENLYLFDSKNKHTYYEQLKCKPKLISNLEI